jgi:hypothetical protein
MKEINIKISGRISNYVFGILGDASYEEYEKALLCGLDGDIETIGEFVKMFWEATLYGGNGMDVFKERIDMEQFKLKCPLFSKFLIRVEKGDAGHLAFYEEILDMNLSDDVNFIEDDVHISIMVDGEEILSEQKLSDFLGEIEEYIDDDDYPKEMKMVKSFWDKNGSQFNMEDSEINPPSRAANGVILMHEWIEPIGLRPYNTRKLNITVEHDNIVDFDYNFNANEFDFSKLAFLGYANTNFHNSYSQYVGSFLAYDNNIIRPEQNIHKDKGFTLYYEDNLMSCNFLIEA